MKEIDWSKAPDWATHYGPDSDCYCESWYQVIDGKIVTFAEADSAVCAPQLANQGECFYHPIEELIARWTGEGLPPVGTVCEWKHAGQWLKVEVAYLSEWLIVLRDTRKADSSLIDSEGVEIAIDHWKEDAPVFRPIRTPEQIAAEERERAIGDMATMWEGTSASWRDFFGMLHDAGYRKVTP